MTTGRPLLIVGSPRSGTTWLQTLLATRPEVASAPETQIFAYYLDHFRKQWEVEKTGHAASSQGGAGLSRLLDDAEFLELCRTTAGVVFAKIQETNPQASLLLEKSPRHATMLDWIVAVIPEAWVIHLVRDPRDTVLSINKAGASWARGWAPTGPVSGAHIWREHVLGARKGGAAAERYLELRYEDLRQTPDRYFADLLDWLDLDHDKKSRAASLAACGIEQMGMGSSADLTPGLVSPDGFFGRGAVGGWQGKLGRGAVKSIEAICHDLMAAYEYEPTYPSVSRGFWRVSLQHGLQRLLDASHWRLRRLTRKL